MAFWNVRHNSSGPDFTERTTLATESRERRYSTGRGYCVEAPSPAEARAIVRDWGFFSRGEKLSPDRLVMARERRRVPVLYRAAGAASVAFTAALLLLAMALIEPAEATWRNNGGHTYGGSYHSSDDRPRGGWHHNRD